MRSLAALRLAALALLASACLPRKPPPDLSMDPAQLAVQVRAAQARVVRVQGDATLRLKKPRSAAFRAFAAAERPDRLHVEALDFFGNPAAVLVASGGRFALYDAQKKVLYTGAATPANLSRLVPIPVSSEALVEILLGSAPLPAGAPAGVTPGDGRLVLRFEDAGATLDAEVGAHAAVEKATRTVAGGAGPGSWQVEFANHAERGGAWFPEWFSLRSDPAKVRLELGWTQVEVNGEVDPGLFELRTPKGARVVEVGDGGDAL
jgi:hypothetical protein